MALALGAQNDGAVRVQRMRHCVSFVWKTSYKVNGHVTVNTRYGKRNEVVAERANMRFVFIMIGSEGMNVDLSRIR